MSTADWVASISSGRGRRGLSRDTRSRGDSPHMAADPTRWLIDHEHLLPRAGRAVDVACGRGRNALWLAQRGLTTDAIDGNAEAVEYVRAEAHRLALPLSAEMIDLEDSVVRLPAAAYDVIVVVHYLHRPLFPTLKAALRPG